jgi:hypothetical protein
VILAVGFLVVSAEAQTQMDLGGLGGKALFDNQKYHRWRLEEGKPVMAWLVLWKNSGNT